jgi:hypothetical protein
MGAAGNAGIAAGQASMGQAMGVLGNNGNGLTGQATAGFGQMLDSRA